MRISQRELMLGAGTLAVLLVGLTFIIGQPVIAEWKAISGEVAQQKLRLDNNRALIASRAEWATRFVEISELMPAFPADQKMDIHWLSVMDKIAADTGLIITKRQVSPEVQIGDVYEMTIDVRDWQGSLDSLVHFLFDLQNLGVMLDIKQLYVKPLDATQLRGRFTLNCAFSRNVAPTAAE